MVAAGAQARRDQLEITAQVDELHAAVDYEVIAVRVLECGARQNGILPGGQRLLNSRAQPFQPRPTIVVIQRNPGPHLLDARGGMEIVGVVERPAQIAGKQSANDGLARAGHAKQDDDHRGRQRRAASRQNCASLSTSFLK